MKNINEIIADYTTGKATLEETNRALKEAGSRVLLDPEKNSLTPQELAATYVGGTPEEAEGFGLLGTGTVSLDKVHVSGGKLDFAVNEVQPDGSVNCLAEVYIAGRIYRVRGDALAELPEARA